MIAISLFSGAGGMDVGFKQAGFDVVAANEMDKHACETFRANHPETTLFEGNIDEELGKFDRFGGVDVLFGGPPCQGFSVAGKMCADDPRSKLIFSFCNVVDIVSPKAFVMENVKALGSLTKFEGVRTALIQRMQNAGYAVTIHILNAKDYGVPQARERVFFIGTKKQYTPIYSSSFQRFRKVAPTLRQILVPLGRPGSLKNSRVCNAKVTLAAKPVLRKSPYAGMLFNGQGRPLNPDGWASTLPASMGGNRTPILDDEHLYNGKPGWVESYHRHLMNGGLPQGMHDAPSYLRRLTIDEAALLQTFPPEYKFCGPNSRVYTQIGNAVPCGLANVIAMAVADTLSGDTGIAVQSTEQGVNLELELA